jgi:hypothetical protein
LQYGSSDSTAIILPQYGNQTPEDWDFILDTPKNLMLETQHMHPSNEFEVSLPAQALPGRNVGNRLLICHTHAITDLGGHYET